MKNIVLGSTIRPTGTNVNTYWIGNPGLFFVKGLMNDPLNSFLAYLFTTDISLSTGTLGVFKMDFSTAIPKYIFTDLTISTGLPFSVTSLTRTSLTDANDFFFAGKAQSLTDGTNLQTFPNSYGYVMKGKTSDPSMNCFSFPSGYSLSLSSVCTVNFGNAFTVSGSDAVGLPKANPAPLSTAVSNVVTLSVLETLFPPAPVVIPQ